MSESKSRTLVWNESSPPSRVAGALPPMSARPLPFAELDRRAAEFLALVPWGGPIADADEMTARDFLAWL